MKDDDELDGILGISGSRASAEAQLLEMVRDEESQSFSLSITFSDGKWTVVTEGLEKCTRAIGQGEAFPGLASAGALVGTDNLMNQTGVFDRTVLPLNQRVQGSSPYAPTIEINDLAEVTQSPLFAGVMRKGRPMEAAD